MRIIYIGPFQFPDKTPATLRALGIGKALRELGHTVIFASYFQGEANNFNNLNYSGFVVYEQEIHQNHYLIHKLYRNDLLQHVLQNENDIDVVVAYEPPSISSLRNLKLCHRRNIKYICDITEWDETHNSSLKDYCSNFNIWLNMRVINKCCDGLIVISQFLYEFYSKKNIPIIKLPPMVDVYEDKWKTCEKKNKELKLIYCGSGGVIKERLDVIVSCVESLSLNNVRLDIIGITKQQFCDDYALEEYMFSKTYFHGRMQHEIALQLIKNADYSIIIRDKTRKNMAGFPTKFVESISCGTAVLTNDTSNLKDYLSNKNGYLIDKDDFASTLETLKMKNYPTVDRFSFHYSRFSDEVSMFLNNLYQ